MNFKAVRFIFFTLVIAFGAYSIHFYLPDTNSNEQPQSFNHDQAGEGRLVWQKYNCQSCHQLYGLGGYLGPDLTNIISADNKGEPFVRAFVAGGTAQMPAYKLAEDEMQLLIEFLKMTDASGKADPRTYALEWHGMISQK